MITLTERAVKHLRHLLDISPVKTETVGIRFGVRAGGCSGYSYLPITVMAGPDEKNDIVFESQGIRIFVDKKSLKIVDATEIEWSTNIFEGFIFKNPNAKTICGCGISFDKKEN